MVKTTLRASILALSFFITLITVNAYAQEITDITLTVSGEAPTKNDATAMALRSAIEQAFGAFVSANTTIINDELVKDEIATISSGNIKNYEEIFSGQLPNGNTTITLKATVSVSKLISYAKSKGSSVEFAGQTFAMNIKLKELNKANEEKAIENMIIQLHSLLPTLFDYKISIGEPKIGKVAIGTHEHNRGIKILSDEGYIIDTEISINRNTTTKLFYDILTNTLQSIALSPSEIEEYQKNNIPTYTMAINNAQKRNTLLYKQQQYYFRSSLWHSQLRDFISKDIAKSVFDFQIIERNNISDIILLTTAELQKRRDITFHVDDFPKLGDWNSFRLYSSGYIAQTTIGGAITSTLGGSFSSMTSPPIVPVFVETTPHTISFPNFEYCSVLSKSEQKIIDNKDPDSKEGRKKKPSLLSRLADGVAINGVSLSNTSRSSQSSQASQESTRRSSSNSQSIDLSDEKYDILFVEFMQLFIPKTELSSITGFEIRRKQ